MTHRLRRAAVTALWSFAAAAAPLAAQDSTGVRAPGPAHRIRAWEGAVVLGGVALALPLDQGLRNTIQAHRSAAKDDAASVIRHMGQPEVFGTVALGTIAAGLVTRRPGVTRAGLRVAGSIALAAVLAGGGKLAMGRFRPYESPADAFRFSPFSSHDAFPSGHATFAFALATSVANEIHRPWVSVALFTAAGGTAWSRLNDDRHWLSDVLAGALTGVVSAQFIDGHWTVFGLRPPGILATPGGAAIGWRVRL